jgi:hypothetical protein
MPNEKLLIIHPDKDIAQTLQFMFESELFDVSSFPQSIQDVQVDGNIAATTLLVGLGGPHQIDKELRALQEMIASGKLRRVRRLIISSTQSEEKLDLASRFSLSPRRVSFIKEPYEDIDHLFAMVRGRAPVTASAPGRRKRS